MEAHKRVSGLSKRYKDDIVKAMNEGQFTQTTCDECKLLKYKLQELEDALPPEILPLLDTLVGVGHILEFGKKKHGKGTWTDLDYKHHVEKVISHARESLNGIDKDHETGKDPLYHVMTRVMMAIVNKETNER
jgi:hypothetical protein